MKKIVLLLLLLTSLVFTQERHVFWSLKDEYKNTSYDRRYTKPKWHDKLTMGIVLEELIDGNYFHTGPIVSMYIPEYEYVLSENWVLLHENSNNGWPHIVYKLDADTTRPELILLVPHRKNDLYTAEQGIRLFEKLPNARWLIMSGASRGYSDASRDKESLFYKAITTISDNSKEQVFISLHGNALKECREVFVTNGTTYLRDPLVFALNRLLFKRGVDLGRCKYYGTTNLNGQYVRKNGDEFLHIEQSNWFRRKRSHALENSVKELFYEDK